MQIGLISDIHANIDALHAVLAALDGVDQIICAGDLTGYYTHPGEVVDEIRKRRIQTLAGNHDVYLTHPPVNPNNLLRASIEFTHRHLDAAQEQFLAGLPVERWVTIDGVRLAIFHGSPWNPKEEYIYPDYKNFHNFETIEADIIVMGHTHRPMHVKVGDRLVVNPGSVGQPRDGDRRASFAILDTSSRHVRFERAAFDMEAVEAQASQAGLARVAKLEISTEN